MTLWFTGRFAAFDTETTGINVDTDRIVTAAVILLGGNQPAEQRSWMADPGIDIPEGATRIHGITTEHAKANGLPANQVVHQIVATLGNAVTHGATLVGHNIAYDLTILDREARRHLGGGLHDAIPAAQMHVIDTMVLDKHAAPYRRRVSDTQGPYQMRTSAETYGLPWDEAAAHGAEYDALQAARVAYRMGAIAHTPPEHRPDWVKALRNRRGPYDRFNDLANVTIEGLHQRQIRWAAEHAASYQEWLRSAKAGDKHDPQAVIDGTWPLRPIAAEGVAS